MAHIKENYDEFNTLNYIRIFESLTSFKLKEFCEELTKIWQPNDNLHT